MSRYTENLKKKITCPFCCCDITLGHLPKHVKTEKHQEMLQIHRMEQFIINGGNHQKK